MKKDYSVIDAFISFWEVVVEQVFDKGLYKIFKLENEDGLIYIERQLRSKIKELRNKCE